MRFFSLTMLVILFSQFSLPGWSQRRLIPHVSQPSDSPRTAIRLANNQDSPQIAELTGYNALGAQLFQIQIALNSLETRTLAGNAPPFLGDLAYLEISGDTPVLASAVYATHHPNSTWASVPESSIQTTSWRIDPNRQGSKKQKVALINCGYREAEVKVEARRMSDGTVLAEQTKLLAPGEKVFFRLESLFAQTGSNPLNDSENSYFVIGSQEPLAITSLAISNNRKVVCENPAVALAPAPVIQQIELLGEATFPEDVAIHQGTGEIFVGGLASGDIQRIVGGQATYFKNSGEDGLMEVIGMAVDAARNRLWVCNSSLFQGNLPDVRVFDTVSGNLLGAFPIPDDGLFHFFNDVALDMDGNAYITDSTAPILWSVDVGLTQIEKYIEDAALFDIRSGFNLNGIALTPDGNYLITAIPASAGTTLYRIDIQTREVTLIELDNLFVGGDGLVFKDENTLVSVLFDISTIELQCDFQKGKVTEFPEISTHLDNATTADIFDGRLYVVNSQFDHLFSGDGLEQPPFTLTVIPLERIE